MTVLPLPALRSDDTLGFLASLGVVELCTSVLELDVRLGWEGVGGAALLDGPFVTTSDLAHALGQVAAQMTADGHVQPCQDPGPVLPANRAARADTETKGKLDPAHLLGRPAVETFRRLRETEKRGDTTSARWLAAMVNQLTNAASTGHRALTPFYAPSGQMTLHQVYKDHLKLVHARPRLLDEALNRWVRVEKETGANLDGRALRDATVSTRGVPANAAVVGATWLGLMAAPLFPQVSGRRPRAIGWEERRGGNPALRWPIWLLPLDRAAVSVLLGHPAFEERSDRVRDASLQALGVVAVCRSQRRALSQAAGALQPPVVTRVP